MTVDVDAIAERVAARGLQVKRKDKDLMRDTGGMSKTKREPSQKPPRDDVKKRYRKKNKSPEQMDKDVDLDKDKRKD